MIKKNKDNSLGRLLQTDIHLNKSFSDKKKVKLYKEIRLLISAGLDVKTAVELLMNEAAGAEQKILHEIDKSLLKGKSLSLAMKGLPEFSNYEIYSIRIGEETGNLPVILEQLELFYNRKVQLKRQLVSALSYPAFVLFVAVGVVYFMLGNIVPMFADIFKRFGGDLPPLTKALLTISYYVKTFGFYFILLLAAACIGLYLNRQKPSVRAGIAKIILRIPILGETVRKIYLARFCQVMHLLTSSKVPLTEAISMVEQMIAFYPLEISMPVIKKQLTNGSSLHRTLSQYPIYEKRMISLIKVAEEVNQLDNMFNQLAQQYNEEIEHQTKVVSSVLEPLIIVIIAGVVGVILVAMYLPLFKLSTTIG